MDDAARELFTAAQGLRLPDGSYWTGMVFPDRVTFPDQETTTYTGAAIVLAADALASATPAAGLFRGEWLPAPLDLAESECPAAPRWTAPQGPETGCCTGLALGPELLTAARTLPSDELAVL